MDVTRMISEIDAELDKLRTMRAAFANAFPEIAAQRGPGRPPKAVPASAGLGVDLYAQLSPAPLSRFPRVPGRPPKAVPASADLKPSPKRTLSPEGRKRISEAMKARWKAKAKAK